MRTTNTKKNTVPIDYFQKGTFTQRLEAAINSCEDRGRKFAARAEISYSTLHNYMTGLNVPTMDNLVKIAEATGVDLNWLAMGKQHNLPRAESQSQSQCDAIDTLGEVVDIDEFYFVPRYDIYASAGHGSPVDSERPMHQMAFRRYWIDKTLNISPKGLAVLGVKGDSMHPEINDKDVLLINTSDTSLRDGIYVLRFDNDLIVKRVQKLLNSDIKIVSSNPVYDPIMLNLNALPHDFSIVGRVIWFGRAIP